MKEPSAATVALRGACPRCGRRTLFAGVSTFAPRCSACGLDFGELGRGGGPVELVALILGGLVVLGIVVLEIAAAPPWWLHLLLWIPIGVASVVFAPRFARALGLAQEYRRRGAGAPE